MLWDGITKVIDVIRPAQSVSSSPQTEQRAKDGMRESRLAEFGLLSTDGTQSDQHVGEEGATSLENTSSRAAEVTSKLTLWFWLLIQYTFLAYTAVRAMVTLIATSSSVPPRSTNGLLRTATANSTGSVSPKQTGTKSDADGGAAASNTNNTARYKPKPVVSMSVWSAAASLVELEERMPWLAGLLQLLHKGLVGGPARVGGTDGMLDRYVDDANFHSCMPSRFQSFPLVSSFSLDWLQ